MAELMYENRPSASAAALFDFVRGIKTREMRSNSMFTPAALDALVGAGQAWITLGERAAIILCPDNENIARLSYYAADAAALCEVRALLPETSERIVCDIVGRDERAKPQTDELIAAGFTLYAKFQRMMCSELTPDETLDTSAVTYAEAKDAPEILELTHQEFDPMTARMHSVAQLEEMIARREVFVVRADGRIAGFTIFDSLGRKVALLDHVIVRPEYRREKIGRKILSYKWKYANDSQHYILWINVLCDGPIRYHESNGFRADGIYDYILTLA